MRGCGLKLQLRITDATDRPATATSVRGQLGSLAQQLRRNRRKLLDSARTHGIRTVWVFGSVARGEAGASSDIDLLVELARERTLLDLVGFQSEAAEIMGAPVDVATADMLKERVRTKALAEALPL